MVDPDKPRRTSWPDTSRDAAESEHHEREEVPINRNAEQPPTESRRGRWYVWNIGLYGGLSLVSLPLLITGAMAVLSIAPAPYAVWTMRIAAVAGFLLTLSFSYLWRTRMLDAYDRDPAPFERQGYTRGDIAFTYLKMPVGAGLVMLAVMVFYG